MKDLLEFLGRIFLAIIVSLLALFVGVLLGVPEIVIGQFSGASLVIILFTTDKV